MKTSNLFDQKFSLELKTLTQFINQALTRMNTFLSTYRSSVMRTPFFVIILMIVASTSAIAQVFTGNTVVDINTTHPYSFADDVNITVPQWEATGGTVSNPAGGPTTFTCNVQWTVAGPQTLTFKNNGVILGTLNVTVNPDGLPAPTVTPATICSGSTATLLATPGAGGTTCRWYNTLRNGTLLATATSYTTPVLTATTTYYVESYNPTDGKYSKPRTAVTVTVNSTLPAAPTATPGSRCGSGTVALSGIPGSGGTNLRWYDALSGGALLFTGTNFTTPSMSASTTYYVTTLNSSGCESSPRTAVVATVNALPAAPTPTPGSRCGTGTVTLSAVAGSGGQAVRWYSALSGGTAIATTNSYTTPSISATTTYYVTSINTTTLCESSPRTAVPATVNPIPGTPTSPGASRCGPGTVTLNATVGANGTTVKWYNAQSGGTAFFTGASYTTPSLSVSTTYYISSYNSTTTCESGRVAVTATINAIPAAPTSITGNERFGPGPFTLIGNGSPSGNYKWYSAAGVLQATSATFTTASIAATTSNFMYATSVSAAGCEGALRWASVFVYPIPEIVSSETHVALNANVTLSTTSAYDSYEWYRNGVLVGTGSTFQTNVAGVYKVRVFKGGINTYSSDFTLRAQFDGLNMNYIVTNSIQVSGVTDFATVSSLPAESNSQTIQYFDGHGSLIQTVSTQGSPSKKDVVVPTVYDNFEREHRKYLPITAGASGHYKADILDASGSYVGVASNYYNNTADKIADDASPYSETKFEPSPLNRIFKQGSEGALWQPSGTIYSTTDKTVKTQYAFNATDEVLKWTYNATTHQPDNGSGSTRAYYVANELSVVRSFDAENNETVTYTDKDGQVILKKSRYGAGATEFAMTYYIYNDLKQLSVVLPPEASVRLAAEYFTATSTNKDIFLAKWAFRYKYDGRLRKIESQTPGADPIYYVYDDRNRLALTQDGVQRLSSKWTYTKYDMYNRPVMTGIYTHGSAVTQAAMSALLGLTNLNESYNGTASTHGYTNVVFPTTNTTLLTATYYDNYSFKTIIGGTTYDYLNSEIAGQETAAFTRVLGQVTGVKTNILGSTNYLWSATYYDDSYRVIQVVAQNHVSGVDRITNKYDFVKLKETKTTHQKSATTYTVHRKFDHDHAARLLRTWHKFNNETYFVVVAENEYNEVGQLVKKKQHSRNGSAFVQNIDYRFNIRGWTEKINDLTSPEASDLFSMELRYHNPTANGGGPQFNGNISEMIWSSTGSDKQSYGYYYDKLNRLKEAKYYTTRILNNGRYNEKIGDDGSRPGYDLNGNILNLWRYGKKDATTYGLMDDLRYTYSSGNQLGIVNDAIVTNSAEEGFKEVIEATGEYTYDKNGAMTLDKNKDVTLIQYNHLNLPIRVNKSNGDYMIYTYDASGRKLSQQVFGTTPKLTEYVGEFTYENSALKMISHDEGRIVPDVSPGAPRPWEYQYFLKDHLGNVRVTFSEKKSTTQYAANFEAVNQASEAAMFRNYGTPNSFTLMNHTPSGTYSQLLNAGNNSQVGLAKSVEVDAGDVIDLEVYGKFETPTAQSTTINFESLLISAFGISSGGTTPLDGQAALTGFQNAFNTIPFIGNSVPVEDTDAPRAYLNYILFDQNFALLDFGFDQIADDATGYHDLMTLHVKVKQKGYLYVYLSNEQAVRTNVYFDDFNMVHHKSVEQVNDYYPFGLTFGGYTRPNSVSQDFKYNGKEFQDELGVGWLDYGARMYMNDLGRWGLVDPSGDKEGQESDSPYGYVANNPVSRTDPDGKLWSNIIGAVVGAAVEYGSQVVNNMIDDGVSMTAFTKNIDIADIGVAAVEGFVTSGASAIKNTALKTTVKIGAEVLRNAVDVKEDLKVEVKSAKSTAVNTVIGLGGGKIMDAAPTPKVKVFDTPTPTQAKKAARTEANASGSYLSREQRIAVENKAKGKVKEVKAANEIANKTPANAIAGGGTEYLKRKSDKNLK